jgi:glycosyltransferase involved in cell wall biosynthesis
MVNQERSMVIIPAFNEEGRLPWVLDAVQHAAPDLIYPEIIVVDNNSNDRTAEIARAMGAKILNCERQGKGWAMQTGALEAKRLGISTLTFLDADLRGLLPEHVNQLAAPVLAGETVMNIGILGGRNSITHLNSRIFKLSGQRSLDWEIWKEVNDFDLQGWRIEWALNKIAKHRELKSKLTELANLYHVGSCEKEESWIRGSYNYAKKYGSAIVGAFTQSGKKE